jgi:DNA-binding NarL/FixJ family response regulator
MTDMCIKKVNLLLVSQAPTTLSLIADSLSKDSLFSWKIETAATLTVALRKVGREHFDVCVVDDSLDEAESNRFLKKMTAEHGNTALVFVNSSEASFAAAAFEGLCDGCIALPNQTMTSDDRAPRTLADLLLAALLARKTREIKAQADLIDELNSALNVLVHRVGKDAFEIEDRIQMNLKLLIFPYVEQLKNTRLQRGQKGCLDMLECNIRKIFSPFLKNLTAKSPRLSYTETKVADLIREGKTSREIATILGVSEKTVLTHRFHIRTKLGIKNKDVSLISHLTSLQ